MPVRAAAQAAMEEADRATFKAVKEVEITAAPRVTVPPLDPTAVNAEVEALLAMVRTTPRN